MASSKCNENYIREAAYYLLLLEATDFFADDVFEVVDFADVEQHFLDELFEHEQEDESCSTAIDQNFSSWPHGQPAFCHK